MKKLLIVSHTPTPNTRVMTKAVVEGASHVEINGIEVLFKQPLETGPEEVLAADAIILGTTENFGYMSGAIKDFFERIYYPCLETTQALPVAVYVKGGLDGQGAKVSVEKILTGLRWKLIQPTLVMKGEFNDVFLVECKNLGMAMSAGLDAGIY